VNKYIVLLRGVNVGGKNLLPMKELKVLLEDAGFEKIKTYIQSGNVVLMGTKNPQSTIDALIKNEFGFTPQVMVLSEDEFNLAISNNPYHEHEGKLVHFYFCKETPKVNDTKLEKLTSESESYELAGNVFYLHAPNGIGRSKLVASIESCLGVAATGRNLNTINKLEELANNA
jgi:uncharacterized protein (DUF1697 family)